MKNFAKLSGEGKMFFIMLDEITDGETYSYYYYYIALEEFLIQEYGTEGKVIETIIKMLEVEELYMFYESYKDEESLAELKTAVEELKDLYGALSESERLEFADLKDVYDIDVANAEAAINAAEAVEETAA